MQPQRLLEYRSRSLNVKEKFYVISVESTHYALMLEKKLKEKFKVDMIPTPRCITASCGLSLKIGIDIIEDVIVALKKDNLDKSMFHIYEIQRNQGKDEAYQIKLEDN